MTLEHNIVFGLGEIKAVIFECTRCRSRVTFPPDQAEAPPERCPSGHPWGWNVNTGYRSTDSPFRALVSSLVKLREPLYEMGFRILLEISEPKT